MDTAVIEGEIIINYRTLSLSARIPIIGFSSDGSRLITERKPAQNKDNSNLAIRSGKIGAKNDEYISWIK
jgi:hypothetical protein